MPYPFPLVSLDLARTLILLESLAHRIDLDRPWVGDRAAELDSQTLDQFLRRHLRTRGARQVFEVISGLTFGGDPAEISLLAVLTRIQSTDGLSRLLDTRGGAQERRFVGGSQRLALRMAEELGAAVELGRPVTRIETIGDGARVHTDDRIVRARRVIVALSPADRRSIQFDPPLPPALAEATERIAAHPGIKVHVVYPRPFWREAGLNGQALTDCNPAPVTVDNSPPDAHIGILTAFVAGSSGPNTSAPTRAQLTEPDLRRSAVIDCLTRYFGPQARNPVDYLEQDWRSEGFTAGCLPAVPPGLLTRIGEDHTDQPARSSGPVPNNPGSGTATWTARSARANTLPCVLAPRIGQSTDDRLEANAHAMRSTTWCFYAPAADLVSPGAHRRQR
nr:NAD(P)/FAD-dependent oxidoreductase [Nocardia arizonensis]